MRKAYRIAIPVTAAAVAAPAAAGEMQIRLEIPRLRVAEYHNPYVAVWLEDADGKTVANLDVWYDVDLRGDDPRKWLPDMRTWWRRAGRNTSMPADGISGPTQAPGTYTLRFSEGTRPLPRRATTRRHASATTASRSRRFQMALPRVTSAKLATSRARLEIATASSALIGVAR